MIGFLKQLETELKLKGFSEKTVSSYLFHNQKFLDFTKKNPDQVTDQDIKSYLAHLISDKKLKPSSINLTICTLKFFYTKVLEKDLFTKISSVKSEKKLPTVLSKEEIKQLILAAKNKKHKILIELMYFSGLRVSEAVNMKIIDLDFTQKIGKVVSGKGKKDRLIILSNTVIKHIESYLRFRDKQNINSDFLFPSQKNINQHISVRNAQKVIHYLADKANIKKRVFCHALRSSFATHLLEEGTDIGIIQELLGHSTIATTQRYTKVSTTQLKKVRSPLDKM